MARHRILKKTKQERVKMRKVTQQIKKAFEKGESLKVGNTRTDGKSVFLHGNEIVKRSEERRVGKECER
mgnify:CR=1 FL=1